MNIVIVGPARSGTTHLQSLLLPYCHSGPETFAFSHLIPTLQLVWMSPFRHSMRAYEWIGHRWSKKTGISHESLPHLLFDLNHVSRDIFLLLRRCLGIPTDEPFLEKTPGHGAFVEEMRLADKQLRLIQITRDPIDCVASRLRTPFGRSTAVSAIKWQRNMSRNDRIFSCQIRYEDLATNPDLVEVLIRKQLGLSILNTSNAKTFDSEHEPWKIKSNEATYDTSVGKGYSSLNYLQKRIVWSLIDDTTTPTRWRILRLLFAPLVLAYRLDITLRRIAVRNWLTRSSSM